MNVISSEARPEPPVDRGSRVRETLLLRVSLWELLSVCGALASVATVLGFLGSFSWALDLFAHFRVQYFVALLAVALLFLLRRRWRLSSVFGFFAMVNLCVIAPVYLAAETPSAANSPGCRAMLINVNTESGRPDLVAHAIQQYSPDLLLLEEINDKWVAALSETLAAFPYSCAMPRDDNFGIGLYSKHPLAEAEITYWGGAEVPSVVAEVQSPSGRFTIIGTHPLPPASAENTRLRDEQLAQIPAVVKKAGSPVLVLGDLNATPWCSAFRQLIRDAGLRDSSKGRGVQPTWPAFMPLLWIPIDHCLHSSGIRVNAKEIGPNVGSDHFPIIVDFRVEAASSPPVR